MLVSLALSEGEVKEILRKQYCKYHSDWLYDVNKIIKNINLEGETIVAELIDGTRLLGMKDVSVLSSPLLKYGDLRKLNKIYEFAASYSSFLYMLYEQYVDFTYEKYYRLKEGDVIVDAGVNVGVFAIKAVQKVTSTGKVIDIEPEINNVKILRKNVQLNNLNNIIIVPKGIWDNKKCLTLNLPEKIVGHSFIKGSFYSTDKRCEYQSVQVDTLDNIIAGLGIIKVDFVKMDIEGNEIEALKGMSQILNGNVNLAIAAYHEISGKPTYKIVISELQREWGYRVKMAGEWATIYANRS